MGCAGAISAQRGDKRDAGLLQDAAAVRVAGGAAAAHLPHLPPPPRNPAHHPAHPHPRHLCLPPAGLLAFPPCFGRYWLDMLCQTAEKVGSFGVETDKQRASACSLAWTVQHGLRHRPCSLTMAKQQWESFNLSVFGYPRRGQHALNAGCRPSGCQIIVCWQ